MQSNMNDNSGLRVPVLALHGSAASGEQWASLGRRLGDSCEVIAPDIPGYGESVAAGGSGLRERAAPLLALLEQSVEPLNLVAHSFGAALALELVRVKPEAILSL